ncbi:MAG: cysteine synthase, partial [Nitrosopumilus sp.]
YNPEAYAAEHEVDFGQARHLLKFFVDKGHNIGESTALALYAILEMLSKGEKGKFIVVVADGIEKYRKNLESASSNQRIQVSLEDAASSVQDYDKIIWVHTQYTPKEEGIEMIAKSLGVNKEKIVIPKASTINQLLSTQQVPDELNKDLGGSKGKSLLICMAGNTSLMTAQVLASKGIVTESLNGGITNLPEGRGKNPGEFIKAATD